MEEKEFLLKLKNTLEEAISLIDDKLCISEEKRVVKKSKRFIKPTIEEIKDYCEERKNDINPEKFYDYYESINWFRGKNKIKDWKAVVRTWENRSESRGTHIPQTYTKKEAQIKQFIEDYDSLSKNRIIKFRGKLCECKGKHVKFDGKIYDIQTGYEITDVDWEKI